MSDVYYNPEKYELEVVAEIDVGSRDYCFDLWVVWKHKETGDVYFATDSGCSCPSPFEDYHNINQLTRITKEYFEQWKKEFITDATSEYNKQYTTPAQRSSFIDKVHDAVFQ